MASLKDIRNRISSVNSSMQITSAMKMVSSSKLKRAQDAIQKFGPYSKKMQELLNNISSGINSDAGGKFTRERKINKVLIVAIASNRGLAGAFNSSIAKAVNHLQNEVYKNIEVEVMVIGKKAYEILHKTVHIYKDYSNLWDNHVFENVEPIARELIDNFISGKYDKIELVYNHFKNTVMQILQVETFLPLNIKSTNNQEHSGYYTYEPSKEEILKELIPRSLKVQFYKAILDSYAAEHGARMTAMQAASDNANTLKQDLIISYNKARQAAITNELTEIISGAQALEN